MNFREEIILRIITQLQQLVVTDGQVEQTPSGLCLIIPNTGFVGVLRHVETGPIEELPVPNPTILPVAYVSFEGARNDFGSDTFITHVIEELEIRIEVLLDRKIGSRDGQEVREITYQVSDFLADFEKLVNTPTLRSAVSFPDQHVTVDDAYINEWRFDDRNRGGEQEILIIIYRVEIANPRDPNNPSG